nr:MULTISPECIES: hypothetical protein [unclassified Bradyrhizobium]
MRRHRGAPQRSEASAARLDRPARRIAIVEIDRSGADDAAAADIDKQRTAIGQRRHPHSAVPLWRAELQALRIHEVDELGEPHLQFARSGHHHLEVLGAVNDLRHVRLGLEKGERGLDILEGDDDVRGRVNARARAQPARRECVIAADGVIHQLDLDYAGVARHFPGEGGLLCRPAQQRHETEQDCA